MVFEGLRGVRLEHSVASSEDEEWYVNGSKHLELSLVYGNGCKNRTMERLKSRAQPVRRVWLCWLRPLSKHKRDDHCFLETIANVVTSLPFIFVGLQAPRKKTVSKFYADSLIGVGVASSLYHASRGKSRQLLRRGDYTMIATSALCLSRALLQSENWKGLFVCSAALAPFQPFLVTILHTGLTEATFARRVQTQPLLKPAHNLHTISSLAGATLFLADGLYPRTPYLHAAWHLVAAVSVLTYNKLLE
ncbi:uncharacterized protein LOC9640266 isoform X2 [Selaginella moellendorffii]|nr:uncharacterized protein LOC9640266 isoform X2 [Selaginella moellendorffii]|eukprot:XP_002971740.2 uncharacterized protein LOC9640266 isoform X2 [Selaginella moellendorffii]